MRIIILSIILLFTSCYVLCPIEDAVKAEIRGSTIQEGNIHVYGGGPYKIVALFPSNRKEVVCDELGSFEIDNIYDGDIVYFEVIDTLTGEERIIYPWKWECVTGEYISATIFWKEAMYIKNRVVR